MNGGFPFSFTWEKIAKRTHGLRNAPAHDPILCVSIGNLQNDEQALTVGAHRELTGRRGLPGGWRAASNNDLRQRDRGVPCRITPAPAATTPLAGFQPLLPRRHLRRHLCPLGKPHARPGGHGAHRAHHDPKNLGRRKARIGRDGDLNRTDVRLLEHNALGNEKETGGYSRHINDLSNR